MELRPDNPAYPRRVIRADEVATAALVRGVYRTEALPDLGR